MKINPRFAAFMKLHKDTVWKSNVSRNVAFMSFIGEMGILYTRTSNILDPRSRIHDQEDFTKFIENYVASTLKD